MLESRQDNFPYILVFLDMKMSNKNGIEIAEIINKKYPKTMIVFITSYIDFALSGYKVGAARYLLKNGNNYEAEFKECMDNAIIKLGLNEKSEEFNFIGGKEVIKLSDVIYVESDLHRLIFHIKNKGEDLWLYDTLDKVKLVFPDDKFCRIHKSYLINLDFVNNFDRYNVYLKDGKKISISKSKYQDFKQRYIKYKGI